MNFSDGSICYGQWKNGELNGFGKQIISNLTYYGNWSDNKLHGFGWILEKNTNKKIFKGEFKDGQKSGFGLEKKSDSDITFFGLWKNNKKNGIGVEVKD